MQPFKATFKRDIKMIYVNLGSVSLRYFLDILILYKGTSN